MHRKDARAASKTQQPSSLRVADSSLEPHFIKSCLSERIQVGIHFVMISRRGQPDGPVGACMQ